MTTTTASPRADVTTRYPAVRAFTELLADPLSPAGIAGAIAGVGLVWRVFSRQKPGEEGHD